MPYRRFVPVALVAAVLAGTVATTPRVTIDVMPRTLLAGGSIRLRCRVPRDAANRRLEFGVEGYRSSQEDLDGENARVFWETIIEHVPCDPGPAYCAVQTNQDKWYRAAADLTVAGCER